MTGPVLGARARVRYQNRMAGRLIEQQTHHRYILFTHSLLPGLLCLALRFQTALPSPGSAPLLIPPKGAAAIGDTGDIGVFCMDCHLK